MNQELEDILAHGRGGDENPGNGGGAGNHGRTGGDTVVERRTKEQAKTKRPPLYKCILLNDDYTPMEFVVEVLERFFAMERQTATRVMLEVHTRGKGVCGVFTYEIAETKVSQVTSYSREHQHPLLCTLEEA